MGYRSWTPRLVHGFADIGGRWISWSSTGYGLCCRFHKSIMHRSIAADLCMHTVGHLRSIDSCDGSTARFSALYFVFFTGLPPPVFCGFEIHLGQEQWISILLFDISSIFLRLFSTWLRCHFDFTSTFFSTFLYFFPRLFVDFSSTFRRLFFDFATFPQLILVRASSSSGPRAVTRLTVYRPPQVRRHAVVGSGT
jgi:hypothetical protein